jgi:dihydropteroate synthase
VACLIAGVLNCTPDSFSDGGKYKTPEDAVAAGVRMAEEGASWIDVGGESTRPGATPVSPEEEQTRVLPVIKGLRRRLTKTIRISVDTYKASTARAAVAAGASLINDISGGLLEPEILAVAGSAGVGVVLGHLRGTPAKMMEDVHFDDAVAEVRDELLARIAAARAAGCTEVWCDPGIGFGKKLEQNLALLRALPELRTALGVPLMVGVSKKAFIGQITGKPTRERAFGTAAAVTAVVLRGAAAVRVHDVASMRDVVKVATALAR